MYKVFADNTLMYDTRVEELALLNPVVTLEENKAGSFSFKITPDHPCYDLIQKRKTVVQVLQDEEIIFSGMCIEVENDFYKQKSIYCEGELAYLNDSIQRPAKYQGMTVRGLLEAYIANHNAQVEEEKQFTVGMVTVTDSNNSIYCFTNMQSTMQELKEDLVDDLGGYLRIRHQNGVKYIDYLADSMYTNTQVIRLGENLVDFTSNIDSSEIATAIIPLGARLEETAVEGLETRLDIKSVNDGLDYVFSQDAVDAYGWIYKVVEWDNVTTAANLKAKGQKYLEEIQFENIVIEAQAVDLHFSDPDIERFKLSDQIRVVSKPHGLNKYFRLTKQTINLANPENDKITLGKSEKLSLSAKTSSANDAIKKAIDEITPASTILQQAVANATALITNAMGGYVYKTNNELFIMDTDNPETAAKVWRWNINGLGYSSTGIDGEYGLAMTMDGAIVADCITTGTLNCDRLSGGTINGQSINGGTITGSTISGGNISGATIWLTGESILSTDYKFQINKQSSGDHAGYYCLSVREGSVWTKDIICTNDLSVSRNLSVYGTKSRVADTDDYGKRLLYCYEMPSPLFGDMGEAETDETGTCFIALDDEFSETIDTDVNYQVFLQAYGSGSVYVAERNASYFIVEGTPNMAFGWEIKAIQKGFDTTRLETYEEESGEEGND